MLSIKMLKEFFVYFFSAPIHVYIIYVGTCIDQCFFSLNLIVGPINRKLHIPLASSLHRLGPTINESVITEVDRFGVTSPIPSDRARREDVEVGIPLWWIRYKASLVSFDCVSYFCLYLYSASSLVRI